MTKFRMPVPATELLKNSMVRYFIMAGFIVAAELVFFWVINTPLGISYLIATPASMLLGMLLNWYFSRIFVFKESKSKHPLHVEFTLIAVTTLVGLGIQLVVTSFCIEKLHIWAVAGKFLAIVVTFFWNYWVRNRFIFDAGEF